jgi:hypothetical protein
MVVIQLLSYGYFCRDLTTYTCMMQWQMDLGYSFSFKYIMQLVFIIWDIKSVLQHVGGGFQKWLYHLSELRTIEPLTKSTG